MRGSQFSQKFNNTKRESTLKLFKSRNVQGLLSDFFYPDLPWDSDYLSIEEYSDVNSKLGSYATFSPRDKNKSHLLEVSINKSNNIPIARKKIVLITDDAHYNRKAVNEMCKKLNIPTMEAMNGEDAVTKVKSSFYNESEYEVQLILMDLEMPIMGGIEATKEIRKLEKAHKKNKKIPIVAVTAHSSMDHKKECLKVGMQEHIVKPVSSKRLKDILEKYAADIVSTVK